MNSTSRLPPQHSGNSLIDIINYKRRLTTWKYLQSIFFSRKDQSSDKISFRMSIPLMVVHSVEVQKHIISAWSVRHHAISLSLRSTGWRGERERNSPFEQITFYAILWSKCRLTTFTALSKISRSRYDFLDLIFCIVQNIVNPIWSLAKVSLHVMRAINRSSMNAFRLVRATKGSFPQMCSTCRKPHRNLRRFDRVRHLCTSRSRNLIIACSRLKSMLLNSEVFATCSRESCH